MPPRAFTSSGFTVPCCLSDLVRWTTLSHYGQAILAGFARPVLAELRTSDGRQRWSAQRLQITGCTPRMKGVGLNMTAACEGHEEDSIVANVIEQMLSRAGTRCVYRMGAGTAANPASPRTGRELSGLSRSGMV